MKRITIKVKCLISIIALIFSVTYAHASPTNISLDANESYPYWSESLELQGMCGEIVHSIAKASGITTSIQFKPLNRMIEDDTNNDLGNPSFYMQNQSFAAIIPIAVYHVAVFSYDKNIGENPHRHTLEDLRNQKVGILKGTLVNRSAFINAGIQIEESYSQESLFKKLQKGRLDHIVEIDLVGHSIINQFPPTERGKFSSSTLPNSASPIAILLAETQASAAEISMKYKKGLKKIISTGEYSAILQKYYGTQGIPEHFHSDLKRFSLMYQDESNE